MIDYLLSFNLNSNYGVAYVYLEFQESSRQTSQHILSCLLKQLADQSDTVMNYVKSRHDRLEIENRLLSTQDILECLIASITMFDKLYLVIDALDEQDDSQVRSELLQNLTKVVHSGAFFYITSRPNIRSLFRECGRLEIRPGQEDVKAYVEDYIHNHPSASLFLGQYLREKVAVRLAQYADGM